MASKSDAYEIRVQVSTLDEASKLLKILGENGYSQVSMGQPASAGTSPPGALLDRAKSSLNRLNNWILTAIYRSDATEKAKAVTAEKIVGVLQNLPETGGLFDSYSEGVISRTVSMVASSVLGDKFSWVAYERTQPRKFWLTDEGLKKARLLSGEEQP